MMHLQIIKRRSWWAKRSGPPCTAQTSWWARRLRAFATLQDRTYECRALQLRHVLRNAHPPMLRLPPSLAFLICMPSGACPGELACGLHALNAGAPIGGPWPQPSGGLTGSLPSLSVILSLIARGPALRSGPIASYSISSAT